MCQACNTAAWRKQLLYPIAEPGLSLLQGDLPQGVADRLAEVGDVERHGARGVYVKESPS